MQILGSCIGINFILKKSDHMLKLIFISGYVIIILYLKKYSVNNKKIPTGDQPHFNVAVVL